ncbi:DUF86 domain-containing protein [bacterium]|nr:DUF86 domain-containing protein [bacterium]
MLEKDVILSKISIIKNCLNTIHKVTALNVSSLDDVMIQDVFVLNLQRAIQAAIDMANIVISERGLKLPATYRECFHVLHTNGLIEKEIFNKMSSMVGFRNIAVHDYQQIDLDILKSIMEKHLKDLEEYYSVIYTLYV